METKNEFLGVSFFFNNKKTMLTIEYNRYEIKHNGKEVFRKKFGGSETDMEYLQDILLRELAKYISYDEFCELEELCYCETIFDYVYKCIEKNKEEDIIFDI